MAPDDPTRTLSRRSLLKTGLVGAAVVVLGSVGLALEKTAERKLPSEGLSVLSPKEYAVLAAIADRLCPAAGPGAPGASALGVALKADRMFATIEPESQKGVKIALGTFENALTGALFGERVVPFTQLSPEAQDRVLASWRDSRITFRRSVYRALSSLVGALYWGDSRTWERIGYPGPPSPAGLRKAYADNLVDLASLRAGKDAKGS